MSHVEDFMLHTDQIFQYFPTSSHNWSLKWQEEK